MRGKVAKRLRKEAQLETISKPVLVTRKVYKAKKKAYKAH